MKLYEMKEQYLTALEQSFDAETGELNEQALVKIDELFLDIKEKGIAVASFIKNLDADYKAIEDAMIKMELRAVRLARQSEFLSNYLKSNMELCSINEISCPYFAIKVKRCPPSVDIINESEISDEYKKVKEVISLDKMKIKEDLLSGKTVSGASVKYNTRLEIR